MRLLLSTLICVFIHLTPGISQRLDFRLGYVIAQLNADISTRLIAEDYSVRFGSPVTLDRTLAGPMGIYLFKFDHAVIHQGNLLQAMRQDERILVAQFDHIPTLRAIPDDPQFFSQWQWLNTGQTGGIDNADIDADRAWDISTGGVTASGDTIVVAIIDDGLDYNHEDITANTWINYHEIDGNGIDDDNNGYIDDIYGWNAYDENNDVWGNNHGLNVAGMVGAVGNNGIGVTGINWQVKLMTIVGGTPESSAIASYAYALAQRKLYEETNGAAGAFVVATNSSWGIDFGQPADAPLWCSFYDSLGAYGILSAGATANNAVDIDLVNDLPTGCPSEYLFSVTALNSSNERTFSAWGLTTVDFGAPGANVLTTRRNNNYGNSTGTSFASPITAGLVGLLYSAPCDKLAELSHTNPAAAAALVRDVIFLGVKPIAELESTLRFGGSLNAGNSMELMMLLCSSCPIPFAIQAEGITDLEATISWSMVDTADVVNARLKPVFSTEWDTIENVTSPLQLTDLIACLEYEIEFESICSDTSTGYQSNFHFETEGCCELPAEFQLTANADDIFVVWDSVFAADYYILQYRPQGTDEWIEIATPFAEYGIEEFLPCTVYEVRLQTSCDTTETAFSDIKTILTKGCGNCIDIIYCSNFSQDASGEWIDSLIVGPLVNHSGNNGGYILFDTLNPEYFIGESYEIWMRPGFSFGTFDEQVRIWIDFNQNGGFDTTEMVVDSVLDENNVFVLSTFTIPETAALGETRMRVSMAYANPFFPTDQNPCGVVEFGEVEDYCITILKRPEQCPRVDTLVFDAVTFVSAFMYWPSEDDAIAYTYRYREIGGDPEYKEFATIDTTANISQLFKCKKYEVQIRTICPFDTTSYDSVYILETDCDVAVEDPAGLLTSCELFPNPAVDVAFLRFVPEESGQHSISLFNMQGQRMESHSLFAEEHQSSTLTLHDLTRYPPGLYFVVVEKNGKRTAQKLILQ